MGKSIVEGANSYAMSIIKQLYIGSKFAILANNGLVDYSKRGVKTLYREISSSAGGLYSKSRGWGVVDGLGYGGQDSVSWKEYEPQYDLAKTIEVDMVDELNSYTEGAPSSIEALAEDYINRHASAEIDAIAASRIYSQVPDTNKFTVDDYKVDSTNIISSLLAIQAKIKNKYNGTILCFISNETDANLKTALLNSPSGVSALFKHDTLHIDFNGIDGFTDGEQGLDLDITYFDKLLLITVPDDRMYTKITVYDGYSDGQTDGGFIPAQSESGFGNIHLLAMPIDSAFLSVKWLITNYLVPCAMEGVEINTIEVNDLSKKLFGQLEISQASVNQISNSFRINNRVLVGADAINNRKDNIYAITSTLTA